MLGAKIYYCFGFHKENREKYYDKFNFLILFMYNEWRTWLFCDSHLHLSLFVIYIFYLTTYFFPLTI